MKAYHSTALQLVKRHCPYALDLREQGIPYPRGGYQVGIAAHACLEAIAHETAKKDGVLDEAEARAATLLTASELVAEGRTYDGKAEPPMSPDDAMAGREIALDWVLGVEPFEPDALVEIGLGLDAEGQPCDYWSDAARIVTILDVVRVVNEADEESARRVVVVRDYKTSWATDEAELDTLQRKIQAVAAWRYFGPADVLRLEVVNLRLQKVYPVDHYAEDGLDAKIAGWWGQIATMAEALDGQKKIGHRPAAPGAGCMGCPYLERCEHAKDYIERRGMHRTLEQRASAYCVALAMAQELAEQLRLETDEQPAEVYNGIVGTIAKPRRKLTEDAYAILWERWEEAGGDGPGFAKAAELSVSNATKIARALHFDRKEKADREALISEVCKMDNVREFGIHPKPERGVDDATTASGN